MTRPGLHGRNRRRLLALAIVLLGLLDVALAVFKKRAGHLSLVESALGIESFATPRFLLLAGAVGLLSVVPGILHGKRFAWWIALGGCVLSFSSHPLRSGDVDSFGVVLAPAVSAALLISYRLFPARADPVRARQGLVWLLGGSAAVLAYGFVGIYFLDRELEHQTSLDESLEMAVRLLFILPASSINPVSRHGAWFIDSVRLLASMVVAISLWHFLRPVVFRASMGRAERHRVEALLAEYARTSLAYFHLLDDKSYFFSDDGNAFIGYKVVGHVAVALGEPIGSEQSCRQVVSAFAEFCDLNGWAFCFHQVTGGGAALLKSAGLAIMKTGEEAIVPVREFALAGKSFKHLRNTVNRLEKEGYTVGFLAQPIPEAVLSELQAVSDAWLADGGHRERTFTLGTFGRDYLRATSVIVVKDGQGRIEAFANVLPSFRSTAGMFDLMRRRPDSADGVMDYLFVRLIEDFRSKGYEGMNLGFAPLSKIEGDSLTARALRLLYVRGGRAFNFQGLRAYKDKWKPLWEPRYLAYRDDIQLPQLALAVARAGEAGGALPLPAWVPRRPRSRIGRAVGAGGS